MNAHDPAQENAGEQRRRRRRPDSGETDTGIAAFTAISTDGPVPSRRELREQRAREEAAAQATQASLSAMPVVPEPAAPSATTTSPVETVTPATPGSGSVNRRSMRERLPEGPAGPAGRGERVPPPRRPVVRTPLAAQGVRGLDETGELSQVRSTRTSDDSPVEVTGPLDWSSAVMSPVEEAAPKPQRAADEAAEPADPQAAHAAWGLSRDEKRKAAESASSAVPDSDAPPLRRSVIKRPSTTTPSAAWAPVSGEGAGAAVPSPSLAPPPAASGVFTAVPKEAAAQDDEVVKDGAARRPRWMSPVGFLLLAVLGVAVGAGIFFLVLK